MFKSVPATRNMEKKSVLDFILYTVIVSQKVKILINLKLYAKL